MENRNILAFFMAGCAVNKETEIKVRFGLLKFKKGCSKITFHSGANLKREIIVTSRIFWCFYFDFFFDVFWMIDFDD